MGAAIPGGSKLWPEGVDPARLIGAGPKLLAALEALYTFPGVRELLAPLESLGSIAAQVEEALREARQ